MFSASLLGEVCRIASKATLAIGHWPLRRLILFELDFKRIWGILKNLFSSFGVILNCKPFTGAFCRCHIRNTQLEVTSSSFPLLLETNSASFVVKTDTFIPLHINKRWRRAQLGL